MDSVAIWRRARALLVPARPAAPSPHLASDGVWDRLAGVALVAAAILVVLTFRDYGVTWDEDGGNSYGVLALDYYLSLLADQRALHVVDLANYGATFDMLAAALNRFSPLGVYETRHLLNGIVGILGLVGCWKLGRVLGGPRAGFSALIFLLLTPNYYGQMFNNPKDIPFAVGGVWASYYMVRLLPTLPRPPFRLIVALGLVTGLALGVRVGGLLFLCYLGLLLTLNAGWQALAARLLAVAVTLGWTSLWRVVLPTAIIAIAVMLAFWPWGQQDPVNNSLHALAFFSHQVFPYNALFDGRYVPASDLLWEYLPTYILLALPELVVALLIAAIVLAATGVTRPGLGRRREDALGIFLIGFSIVFPVAYPGQLRSRPAGPADLSGRADGRAALGRARPAQDRRRRAGWRPAARERRAATPAGCERSVSRSDRRTEQRSRSPHPGPT